MSHLKYISYNSVNIVDSVFSKEIFEINDTKQINYFY